ncbi:flagellar protein FlgN [Bordetella genomosp. 1]|uniref:Flagellar protein FlgN n=1 Tax=Bordetella genomosp. 1 TaxID=1395607 RepID=A0A261S5G6_9BORD|nr:flagellar protein FlgN [Bordetella genomosp. 1]OZI32614.1 flagellar protein FlgN [Bordetella genomosp. 1]OZI66025.1 flagellar protein FlgN [Bordetella genomosp. 1]
MNYADQLKTCLEREAALVVEFIAALDAEAEALLDRKAYEALHLATQRKEALTEKLVQLSQQRDALLLTLGVATGHAGTDAAAAMHPELAPIWELLQVHAQQAREKNSRNGTLIEINLRSTTESLEALRALGGANSTTYDAQGRGKRAGYGPTTGSARSIVAT